MKNSVKNSMILKRKIIKKYQIYRNRIKSNFKNSKKIIKK